MNEWKDATSYAHGERGTIAPQAWDIVKGGVRICVVRSHLHYPNRWVMHSTVGFDTHNLGLSADEPPEVAQLAAVRVVEHKIQRMLEAVRQIRDATNG
jgi:hypothetical protein